MGCGKKALSFKKIEVNPAIVKIQTNLSSDWGLSMLSNCITLTPGTITMDIYEEKIKITYMCIGLIALQMMEKRRQKLLRASLKNI